MDMPIPDSGLLELHVSNLLVRALIEVVQRRGIHPEALSDRDAGVVFSRPADARVPLGEFQSLLARAVRLTGEPALGLQCALFASESSFGLMSPLVSHAQTLRHAIALLIQFSGLLSQDLRIELTERAGSAQLRCKLHAAMDRNLTELVVAGLVRTLRTFGCDSSEIRAVRFEHKRPAHHHAYTVAFHGVERFGQAHTEVEFAASALDRPHIHWEPELQAVIRVQAERAMEQLSRPWTYTERIRAFLASRRELEAPDMAIAARELGLSVRSLRRRLLQERTTYRELIQATLSDRACTMLRNPDLTLQSISHSLGFTDAPSFHRAFRRWTGSTPLEYREDVLARGPVARPVPARGRPRSTGASASYDHHR